jgi:fatty acid desaturase
VHFLLSTAMAASIGFMLFHSQHVYNPPYMVTMDKTHPKDSGLKGSSFIHVPWALTYFTGGIEYHHIHHMNSKIPGYHLKQYHTDVVQSSDMYNSHGTIATKTWLWRYSTKIVTNTLRLNKPMLSTQRMNKKNIFLKEKQCFAHDVSDTREKVGEEAE